MSKINQFNAASSEAVLSQKPSTDGEVFNLLYGHTPELPGSLGTAQGSNNSDYNTNADKTVAATASNPHGSLTRNVNIESLEPAISAQTLTAQSTLSGVNLTASGSFAGISIATATFSGTFSQTLPILGGNNHVSQVVVNAIYSGSTTASNTFPVSSVNSSGAGWTQVGNTIVWTNGTYPAFSGASSAAGGRLVPFSGQAYYLNISYNSIADGSIEQGEIAPLNISTQSQQVRVGYDNFGTSLYGTSEVYINNFSGTRDSLSMPVSQDINSNQSIPNVGSRFFR